MIKVYVGDGFREVLPNEPLLEGDDYWSESCDRWLPSHNARGGYPRTKGVYYRRKIGADAFSVPAGHSVQPYPPAGEGYRILDKSEALKEGDEFWVSGTCEWVTSLNVGQGKPQSRSLTYRRKIETPTPVKAGNYAFTSSDFTPSSWREIDKAYAKKVGASLGSCHGYPVYHEPYEYPAKSKGGFPWTYSYKGISGYPIVRTTFDEKILPIGTRLRIHEGSLYRPLTQYDDPRDYRNLWIKENGTDEFERITWYDKTGINGDTFDNLFHNYVFEGGSLIGKAI